MLKVTEILTKNLIQRWNSLNNFSIRPYSINILYISIDLDLTIRKSRRP